MRPGLMRSQATPRRKQKSDSYLPATPQRCAYQDGHRRLRSLAAPLGTPGSGYGEGADHCYPKPRSYGPSRMLSRSHISGVTVDIYVQRSHIAAWAIRYFRVGAACAACGTALPVLSGSLSRWGLATITTSRSTRNFAQRKQSAEDC
jgi:hypothetical protein